MDILKSQSIYIGAGKHRLDGWFHADIYPFEGIDAVFDVTKKWPFPDNSFIRVYSQDTLEHLPPESKVFVMNEIWRILKNSGTMEHYVPNAGTANDFNSPSHLSHWSLQQFEHFDIDSYRYEKNHEYEGFIGKFKKIFAELVNYGESIHVRYEAIK